MKTFFHLHRSNLRCSKKNLVISFRLMLLALLMLTTISVYGNDTISNLPKKEAANSNQRGIHNGHEWVDLGLPSGTLWASCNIGATTPEGYGDYFAWGEVTTKNRYDYSTYKYGKADDKLTKYCTNDNITELEPEDDAAAVKWRGHWRMPNDTEQWELLNLCKWEWTDQEGVIGCKVTGPNSNFIFLPAAGGKNRNIIFGVDNEVRCWGNSIESDSPFMARGISYFPKIVEILGKNAMHISPRYLGLPIRPVCPSYVFTFLDYLGTAYLAENHIEGDIITEPAPPADGACSDEYEFVGWSEEEVPYGAQTYTAVTFAYTMPDHAVTLYPVYRKKNDDNFYTSFIFCEELGKVVEWYPTKLLLHTPYYQQTFTVHIDDAHQSIKTNVVGKNLLEINGIDIENNAGKRLVITCEVDGTQYALCHTIPVVVSRKTASTWQGTITALDKNYYQYLDLIVRDNATLTINGSFATCNTFNNIYIHPTAKIVVQKGRTLIANSVSFWGGIDDIYNGSNYDLYKYGVPQLALLEGNLQKTVETMDYIMRVDLEQMYQMGVPYDVNLADITYWDGSAIELGNELYVSAYDGQARANREKMTWIWEADFEDKLGAATLKAGVGYTISAEPQYSGDSYSTLRLPMKNNIDLGATEAGKTVDVFAYANTKGVTITDNHKGWNYISNPYMTSISGGEADSKLVLGYLKETDTGSWEWENDDIRYVTIPADNGKDYHQMKYSEAVLKPFKSYFVQIAQEGELSFALASRQNAPARYMQVQTEQEVELEVLLSSDQYSDNMGLLIAEQYSPAYEINADLEKMTGSMSVYTIYGGHQLAYNALSPANAEEWIPVGYIVPNAGEYTFQLDEKSVRDNVQHCYLMDYETGYVTDLVEDIYTFVSATKQSESRFAINIVLSKEDSNTTTGVDNSHISSHQAHKFIYNGELYILNNGVIYNANGQTVRTINK